MSFNFFFYEKETYKDLVELVIMFTNGAIRGAMYLKDTFMFFAVMDFALNSTYTFSRCQGASMLPTIEEKGEIVFIDRFSYFVQGVDYKRGDVVISISPYDRHKNVCKRIVAVEGDMMPIQSKNFPFNHFSVVPRGHVWLEGDNANNSTDSRHYGPVSTGLLQGKVFAKLKMNNFPYVVESIPSGLPPRLIKKEEKSATHEINN